MKKALGILSVLVLITVMMISSNAEQKLDDTVGVSFNVSSSRELSVANESFVAVDSPDLTWYYHGVKETDKQFTTGQSGTDYWTLISTGEALADTYVTFSQGQWSFEIKAVRTEENGTMTQVYYGRTNANVLLTKENRTINISVSPFVSGVNGTLVLSNVYIAPQNGNANVEPNKLYINGAPIDITEDLIDDFEGGKAINYRCNVAPGSCTVEVKRVSVDNPEIVLASASKTVVVYSGLTTTISGSVEEDTTSGRFDVNDDFVINTKEDLILFRDLVNEVGINFSGKTVKLAANIDLAGVDWKPVGQTSGYSAATYFQGTFDGNGKTISNLTIPESSWEDGSNEGQNYATGFFGFIDEGGDTIKNVTFKNANVTGHHWVGVVAGYMTGTVEDVTVENATVFSTYETGEADGDKAGGVLGYLNSGSVSGCTVKGSTISAVRDCGSVVGYSTASGTITGNTAENCTVYYSTDNVAQIGGEIAGKRSSGVSDNTATNVSVIKSAGISSADGLSAAINAAKDGDIIILSDDIVLTGAITINKDITLEGNGSYTISGYPVSVSSDSDTDVNVTFKKVNFATPDNSSHKASSVYASGLTGKVVFEECTFINPQWECIQITPMDGAEVVVNNCSFIVDGNGTYAQAGGTKVERLLHIQNTAASGNYTATITNNSFIGVDLCRNAVIDVDDIAKFENVTCGGNTFANHDGIPVSTLSDGMIYININGIYDAANVATNTYAQFTQTTATVLHH